ncbi:MAG TPA: CapA family protein [Fimbriimonadaceae bacterium]|nr:CapA family protein [Fimbriimonadaceae bacterium]
MPPEPDGSVTALAPSHVTLDAVGDIMLDRYVGEEIERHGTAYPLSKVRRVLAKADLAVANLECPLTRQPRVLPKSFAFRCPPERVAALSGIQLVTVANNHTLDCGRPGLSETLSTLRSAGIAVFGSSTTPAVVERHGIRIAFLGFSDFPESAPGDAPGIVYYDRAAIAAAVTRARSEADVVVVFAHWGIEGDPRPSARQREEASEIARAGADLILGAHPHVLQPVERIGHTVVAYSMGNFVFDPPNSAQARTAIYRFTIGRDGVTYCELLPCLIEACRPALIKSGRSVRSVQRARQPITP